MAKPRKRKPHRIEKKKSIFQNRFFWLVLLILISTGFLFYFVIFSSTFQIKEIKITGNQKVAKENIQKIIEEKIKKSFLFLNSKSIFLINSGEINKSLLEKFPEVSEIDLKRKFPDILIVEIKERVPIGIWCQEQDCFYIDKEGIVFEKSPSEDKLIIRPGFEETGIFIGKEVLEKNYLEAILEILEKVKENLKIDIKEFVIFKEGRLNAKTSGDWEIYFDIQGDISQQISNLILVLEEKISPEKRRDLKYIDLRFGNRIYFK